ncbi:energy-coupling factor transport system substrate-specific component [Paramicrobacterium humi]|uniref:Energy-coupling factor transport system substrate-specific component n=1 Tax=Paramicrobacterium humi TaxID=640635 RepID=A0A1H4MIC0_9MICO|nr:ECF transporter S component [Microbacterium humi]SEB82860.1 energy-coupling factor transport system substrate-specific component [Microbacterium humi]
MFSTRLLMTCAAIGVGSGLVFTAAGFVNGIVAATVPVLYGLAIGVYFLPGVIAQSLLRRGGVAIITGLIAGLVASAVNPAFVMQYIGTAVAIGLLQEVPFAVTKYRYWKAWVFYLAAVVMGLVFGAGVFIGVGLEHFAGWVNIVYFGTFVLSPVLFTWIGRLIAAGIDRTGVARGVQKEIDRRRNAPHTAAMTAA